MDTVTLGLMASLIAGLGTGLGALPVLFSVNFTERFQGILLGLGGGVMLAATSFSLIIPGTEAAITQGFSQWVAALIISIGMILGGITLWIAHERFPHEHFFKGAEGGINQGKLAQIWLFVIAITLHNFPEGLAVGVGFGADNNSGAMALATGIGLQNMPEGLVVAIALKELNYSSGYALRVSTLTGLVEPVGGLIGASIVSIAQPFLPWAMAFAAGAMLFVIIDEILPEINEKGLAQEGTMGVMLGFVIMMVMDIALAG
ncbi:zinc/iron permease [Gloeothece citriformis PCC 7424]|uniref:Zinc/iron permease n=1 Tax=Gloeothece citriformis (strain PCC 7424) TaxID=65393 RepID=B7KK41_GLOC7|nr:ZIP family metal transporter [Gloeothece citriformis]ACK70926.1 zinc/iron permease [Gloeothece citriformis PCC 7424]